MKKIIKWFGIIALAAIFGFTFTACDKDDPPDNGDSTITISGTPRMGAKLTAVSSDNFFYGDYQWYYGYDPDGIYWNFIYSDNLSGQNNSELIIRIEWLHSYIKATRTAKYDGISVYESNILGPVLPITITGTPKVGEKLIAITSGDGWKDDFGWYYADSANATIWTGIITGISGNNKSELTITSDLVGKFISANRGHSSLNTGHGYPSNTLGPVTN